MTSTGTISFAAAGQRRWDAIVVGAGPAGALAARQLAREGTEVLLLDRKAFPRWKVCGACVNQNALSVLKDVNLHDLVERLGAVPIEKFQLCVGSRHATLAIPGGVAVSRAQFDAVPFFAGAHDFRIVREVGDVKGHRPLDCVLVEGYTFNRNS